MHIFLHESFNTRWIININTLKTFDCGNFRSAFTRLLLRSSIQLLLPLHWQGFGLLRRDSRGHSARSQPKNWLSKTFHGGIVRVQWLTAEWMSVSKSQKSATNPRDNISSLMEIGPASSILSPQSVSYSPQAHIANQSSDPFSVFGITCHVVSCHPGWSTM
jgi:hypothetical protein